MRTLPGAGAIIKDSNKHVLMVRITRRGMERWELPTRIRRKGESIFMTLYKCVEEESSSQIVARIQRPVCLGLNISKLKGISYFGIFFECTPETNNIKLTEYTEVKIPKDLRQEIIGFSFQDWHTLNAKEIHPQHLKILQIWDKMQEDDFFTIVSDADEEHVFYENPEVILKPIVLGLKDKSENINVDFIQEDEKGELIDITNHFFEVGLSFPGEIRNEYVFPLFKLLEQKLGKNKVFYDNQYKSQLARINLDSLLQDVYLNRTKLIVVFLCKVYSEKEWCGLELRVIRELIKTKQGYRIMPIKIDDGDVDGIFSIDGYIDIHNSLLPEIAESIQERIQLIKMKQTP